MCFEWSSNFSDIIINNKSHYLLQIHSREDDGEQQHF